MTQFPGAAQRLSADPVVPDSAIPPAEPPPGGAGNPDSAFRPLMRDLVDTFNTALGVCIPDTVVEYLTGFGDGAGTLLLSMLEPEGPGAELLDWLVASRLRHRADGYIAARITHSDEPGVISPITTWNDLVTFTTVDAARLLLLGAERSEHPAGWRLYALTAICEEATDA